MNLERVLGLIAIMSMVASCGDGAEDRLTPPVNPDAALASSNDDTGMRSTPDGTTAENAGGPSDGAALAALKPDATRGASVFARCRACHVLEPGTHGIGPSLAGVVGRPAGTLGGYAYSTALQNSGINWSKEQLSRFLENPRQIAPGNKMMFVGLPDAQDRADVIAYIESGG
ncbi:c-type cytochrome [Parerythrobacter lacustris]|uniref:Cytochrome c family protein n=1 Tax=Parerythrobacter lacustris TaxID=2969984 RepID=A0ABT1XU60_9SPHN|nr:cytochrome c family protein [Parerythrobacter lacustris]MCR2835182.1 cytochrome c family protein [Parerythrobacter lacustris]